MSNDREENTSFGVFKPVGHVVIAFPDADGASAAADAMTAGGIDAATVRRLDDREMVEQIDRDMARASPLAAVGQELNLVKAHRDLATQGCHWLVVHAPEDALASRVAEIARSHGAIRAQSYGRFIIEELIEQPGALPQVGESPDRGLDTQTNRPNRDNER